MANNLLFKRGLYQNLPATKVDGTIYFTTDEGGMYVDIGSGSTGKRVRVQGSVLYFETLQEFANKVAPPYSKDVLYFIAKSADGTDYNALVRWNGTQWVQLNVTADSYSQLANRVYDLEQADIEHEEALDDHGKRISALETWKTGTVTNAINDFTTRVGALETWKGTASGQLSAVIEKANDNADAIDELEGWKETASGKISTLEGWKTTASGQISTLEGWKTTASGKISTLEGWKTTAQEAITKNADDIKDLFDADDAFTKTIGTIQGSIRDLDNEVDQLRTDVNGRIDTIIGTDLSKIAQDIKDLQDTDDEHDKSIENLNKSVSNLNTTVTGTNGHASRIQALEQASQTHGTDIQGLKTTTGNHETRIKNLETAVGENEDKIEELQADLGDISKLASGTVVAGKTNLVDATNALATGLSGLNATINGTNGLAGRVTELEKLPSRVSAVETKATNNATAIGELEDALDNLETSLENQLATHIKAANAMRFRNDVTVNSKATLAALKTNAALKLQIGDTIVVSTAFNNGTTTAPDWYNAGDLLIIGGTEGTDGVIPPASVTVTHVDTGYGDAHDLILSAVKDADNNQAIIQLKDVGGKDLGSFRVLGAGNIDVEIKDTNIQVSMTWESFDP